jgi:hypothetical protein
MAQVLTHLPVMVDLTTYCPRGEMDAHSVAYGGEMTSYVANHQKKIRICQEREDNLRRLIANGRDEAKLLKAAEIVRDARIRVLQAKKAQISPEDTPERAVRIARIDKELETARATTPNSILAEFRSTQPPSAD